MKIFLGDLHIGGGDALDDFMLLNNYPGQSSAQIKKNFAALTEKMHKTFESFIEFILSLKSNNERIELVLLGDTLDCLQIRDLKFASPEKIERIIKAHKQVFDSLNRFVNAGGEITYVVGNHDHELMSPDCFNALKEAVPEINLPYDGLPVCYYIDEDEGVYAEHGNQTDPMNKYKDPCDPYESTIGSFVVTNIINPLEEKYPFLDNLNSPMEVLWTMIRKIPDIINSRFRKALLENVQFVSPWLRNEEPKKIDYKALKKDVMRDEASEDSSLVHFFRQLINLVIDRGRLLNTPETRQNLLEIIIALEEILKSNTKEGIYARAAILCLENLDRHPVKLLRNTIKEKHADFAYNLIFANEKQVEKYMKKGDIIGKPPEKIKCLVFAHYHTPKIFQWEDRFYANTGTWKGVAIPSSNNSFILRQLLPFVVFRSKGKYETPEVHLMNFKKTKQFRSLFES